jgi:hypothetical protein
LRKSAIVFSQPKHSSMRFLLLAEAVARLLARAPIDGAAASPPEILRHTPTASRDGRPGLNLTQIRSRT